MSTLLSLRTVMKIQIKAHWVYNMQETDTPDAAIDRKTVKYDLLPLKMGYYPRLQLE
jgi:hypothetical protein